MKDNRSIEQLILAIKKEYELYEDILTLNLKKRDLIVSGDIKELDEVTAKEQALILSIGKIEEIRIAIMENIKKEYQLGDIQDIVDLAAKVEVNIGNRLIKLKDDFSILLKKVKDTNELNGKLIQQSLEYIEFNTNLLSSINEPAPIYNNKANDNPYTKANKLFDLKV